MRTAIRLTILIFGICSMDCLPAAKDDSLINKRIESFTAVLSFFPPNVKDTTEANIIKQQLLQFIDSLYNLEQRGVLPLDEQYYLWMGKLYHFAYNLNVPGAWKKSEVFYKSALQRDPKSIEGRMALSAHYANSWDPGDTSSYERLDKGYSLLKSIYRDGNDTLNPALYSNMLLFGVCFHSKAICYDAMYKFMKYCPDDTNINTFRSMIGSIKDNHIQMQRNKTTITYENKIAKFKVRYPDDFLLFSEDHDQNKQGIGILMLETPMTETDRDYSIRNSISIIATPTKIASASEVTQRFFNRIQMAKDSVRSINRAQAQSYYFSSRFGEPEKYQGITTIIKAGNYVYQISYMATASTFTKNLNFYLTFEQSLTLL